MSDLCNRVSFMFPDERYQYSDNTATTSNLISDTIHLQPMNVTSECLESDSEYDPRINMDTAIFYPTQCENNTTSCKGDDDDDDEPIYCDED